MTILIDYHFFLLGIIDFSHSNILLWKLSIHYLKLLLLAIWLLWLLLLRLSEMGSGNARHVQRLLLARTRRVDNVCVEGLLWGGAELDLCIILCFIFKFKFN
jgi:hypothetical protein